MRYIPGINRARENPVDGRGVPRFRRMLLAGADRHPLAGFQPQPVDLRDRCLNGLQRQVFLEDQPDRFRFFLVDEELFGEWIGTVTQHRDAAAEFSPLLSALNRRFHTLDYQVAFEGRERDQDVQQHPAGTGGSIDVLRDADEVDIVIFEKLLELNEIND